MAEQCLNGSEIGPAFDELCVRAAKLAAEGVVHAHPALLARASQLEGFPTIFIGTTKFEGSDHSTEKLLAAIEQTKI